LFKELFMKKDEKGMKAAAGSGVAEGDGPSFEHSMKRLEEIVEKLESGDLPLDESLRLFEEGIGLSKRAAGLLDQAERKVEALTRTADGSPGTEPFEIDPEEGGR
jgi:exodeoxyribonuclease VII small subunit